MEVQVGEKLLLNVDEAAAVLGVSRATLYRAVRRGELRLTKLGRRTLLARTELERFVATLPEAAR